MDDHASWKANGVVRARTFWRGPHAAAGRFLCIVRALYVDVYVNVVCCITLYFGFENHSKRWLRLKYIRLIY